MDVSVLKKTRSRKTRFLNHKRRMLFSSTFWIPLSCQKFVAVKTWLQRHCFCFSFLNLLRQACVRNNLEKMPVFTHFAPKQVLRTARFYVNGTEFYGDRFVLEMFVPIAGYILTRCTLTRSYCVHKKPTV